MMAYNPLLSSSVITPEETLRKMFPTWGRAPMTSGLYHHVYRSGGSYNTTVHNTVHVGDWVEIDFAAGSSTLLNSVTHAFGDRSVPTASGLNGKEALGVVISVYNDAINYNESGYTFTASGGAISVVFPTAQLPVMDYYTYHVDGTTRQRCAQEYLCNDQVYGYPDVFFTVPEHSVGAHPDTGGIQRAIYFQQKTV